MCGLRAPSRRSHGPSTAKELSTTVNAKRTRRADGGCRSGRAPFAHLVFRYAQGPPADVTVWGEECGLDNRYLESALPAGLMRDLSRLLG
ncbi:hypothetical protein ABGB18_19500 [Nonomuraea sp. B12E4]|uniref:hypothetical protein n=1 Tax=Nonomuraea sp. B12E4 TaxID=3153564 RepID=UPI00325C8E1B